MKTAKKARILGTFEGECADSNITNLNGMDITRPVWESVFSSEDYARAIELGWYIGFLGHPEDPGCMDFEHACIVMTEGYIDTDGKVYGKFNLVDTPVGRIVKSFIDAGVTFGISVRGAGDLVDNSVDPDTFVFRGFDLVTFPAFPESIPEFDEVAASSDIDKQRRYKSICASVKQNIDGLSTVSSCEIVQQQFAPQSEIYSMIEDKKSKLKSKDDCVTTSDMLQQQVNAMTQLYLDTLEEKKKLQAQLDTLSEDLKSTKVECSRKIASLRRIHNDQIQCSENKTKKMEEEYERKIESIQASSDRKVKNSERIIASVERDSEKRVEAMQSSVSQTRETNLKYRQEINSAQQTIAKQESIIASLRKRLDKTVVKASEAEKQASNRDEELNQLRNDVRKSKQESVLAKRSLERFQQAYASLYASAVGCDCEDISINASTSVEDLQRMLGATNIANIGAVPSFEFAEDFDIVDAEDDDSLAVL